ncbi:MAG: hypothetical protein QNJ44_04360 [Rhodobacter sp.]|nr:hypothetical protein [Rhodobacter sp.]
MRDIAIVTTQETGNIARTLVGRAARSVRERTNLVAATNQPSDYVLNCMRLATNSVQVEGYSGNRFHEGAEAYDAVERFCIKSAAELFGSKYASVQAWRCTNGLLGVTRALAKPGDRVLGLECASGGYYATSTKAHLIGKLYDVATYTVSESDCRLDYDLIRERALHERPKIIFAGDTSHSRDWNWPAMRSIADEAGAYLVADISQTAGLIASEVLSSPVQFADVTLFATYKTFRGPHGCIVLANTGEIWKAIQSRLYPELQGSVVASTLAGLAATLEEAGTPEYAEYQRHVVDVSRRLAEGVAAQGVEIVTGGTDNHGFIAVMPDDGNSSAADACQMLSRQGILTNKTPIPFDRRSLFASSGVRIGASYIANLEVSDDEIDSIAGRIGRTIRSLH